MTSHPEKIGFIGLGLMGQGMAHNIAAKGYPLSFFSRRVLPIHDTLFTLGAKAAASPAELAANCDIVFLVVTGSRDVEALIRGPQGLKMGLKAGAVVVDCSTSDPTSTALLAAELAEIGVSLVDAPLSRTPKEAWAGTLDTMVGADATTFARIKPVLETWAGRIVHIGGVGDGHRMKLINNFISLGYAALYAEAMTVAQAVGIDPSRFDAVIRNGRMDCGFYQTFMGYVLEGNKEAHKFTLSNAFKDLRYLESMADAAGISNSLGNAVKNAFALALANGGEHAYVPMLPELIGKLNNIDLSPPSA
jgi:3-hydroxyisobutyrate dehydrogenase-like beta-hydroxyacid dehydrogenase